MNFEHSNSELLFKNFNNFLRVKLSNCFQEVELVLPGYEMILNAGIPLICWMHVERSQ